MPKTSPRTQARTLKRPKLRLSKETLKDLTPGSAKAVKGGALFSIKLGDCTNDGCVGKI